MKVLILKARTDYGPGFVQVGRTISSALGVGQLIELSKGNWVHIYGGNCGCFKCKGRSTPPGISVPISEEPPKRRGRPRGSKNKPKELLVEESPPTPGEDS